MIPLRDTIPSRNYPVVNNTLIGVNIAVFLFQMIQGPNIDQFIYTYALVPAKYTVPQFANHFSAGQQIFSLFSFMFLHGGFLHILGNMWSLYIFGDNVEDTLGHFRYFVFYILSGFASGLFHLFLNAQSTVPTVGASGAIAGVMGAYFLLYPGSRILTLIPIIIIPWIVEIPAFFFIGFWFVLQMLNAAGSQALQGGVAWWAHVGGFIAGIVLLKTFQLVPRTGATEKVSNITVKKKSERLQVIHPVGREDTPHLYGYIEITPYELMNGAHKTVNVPWGFHNRLFKVKIQPGTKEGNLLRLQGLGKIMPDGGRGDLYLKIVVRG